MGGGACRRRTLKYHYSGRYFAHSIRWGRFAFAFKRACGPLSGAKASTHAGIGLAWRSRVMSGPRLCLADPVGRGLSQVGSLAGAAHLLKDNAGVLR